MRRKVWHWLGLCVLLLGGCTAGEDDSARTTEMAMGGWRTVQRKPAVADQLNFLVFGDWGGNTPAQMRVAETMATYVQQQPHRFDGALITGDNFYTKLSGVDDPKWNIYFENMYDPRRLAFAFYATLGNHDYENGKEYIEPAYAAQKPTRFTMPARWYRLDLPAQRPLVTLLMLDSNLTKLSSEKVREQTRWLERELASVRNAPWLIVVAHHPLYSNGQHGDGPALQKAWGGLFQRHGADFYLCGHDHDLQHLEIGGLHTSFVISGGGGKSIRPMERDDRGPFSTSSYGFAHLQLTPQKATVRFINDTGGTLHVFERTADGVVKVLSTVGVDPTTRPATQPATQPLTAAGS